MEHQNVRHKQWLTGSFNLNTSSHIFMPHFICTHDQAVLYALPPSLTAQLADAKSMINIIVSSIKPTIYLTINADYAFTV